ncbi:MAG TPA: DoxX family protein [Bacteroidia bacterium]|nr:DoxX family protein [Bacteroidia bacterium]HNP97846.1 DoxX family protein [Bacteroidia bacterium]
MKKTKIFYWITTVLFGGFMIFSAIPDVISSPDAVNLIHDQLGYPLYFVPFIGIVKLIGAVVLFIPGIPRLKEWAFAGLIFDLVGALYSLLCIGGGVQAGVFMSIIILVGLAAYYFHHKMINEKKPVSAS